jgi:hypothetical protein
MLVENEIMNIIVCGVGDHRGEMKTIENARERLETGGDSPGAWRLERRIIGLSLFTVIVYRE